jgi:hypothetical protein
VFVFDGQIVRKTHSDFHIPGPVYYLVTAAL